MDDRRITDLYWDRDEEALALTERALGGYLLSIARRILGIGLGTAAAVLFTGRVYALVHHRSLELAGRLKQAERA